MNTLALLLRFIALLLLVACLAGCQSQRAVRTPAAPPITPPPQPEAGPGGKQYRHAGVLCEKHGSGANAYYLFTPAEPVPASAPVVVFMHGWSALQPWPYQAWINHIVRRGNIVIYPVYQNFFFNLGIVAAKTAMRSTKQAFDQIGRGPIRPELDHFAIVGHSMGGSAALNMAVQGPEHGLPVPSALMIVQPGAPPWYPMARPEDLPKDLRVIVLVGDADHIAGDRRAREIYDRTPQIPADRKAYGILQSDDHGTPPLLADHFSICAPILPEGTNERRWLFWTFSVDALDFYGTWKLFDALTDCALNGLSCASCTGGAPGFGYMGFWSDGQAVKPIVCR